MGSKHSGWTGLFCCGDASSTGAEGSQQEWVGNLVRLEWESICALSQLAYALDLFVFALFHGKIFSDIKKLVMMQIVKK